MTLLGLGLLAAKASAPAVVKALGWGAKVVHKRRRDASLVGLVREATSPEPRPHEDFLSRLGVDESARLGKFMESAEVEHLAMQIATSRYLGRCGEREFPEATLHEQLQCLIKLHVGLDGELLNLAAATIYGELEIAVAACSSDLIGDDSHSLPASTRLALLKSAAAQAAAATRNADLLRQIVDMTEIGKFEQDYRSQLVSLHGSMKLPHSNTSRSVPYDRLFVQPRIQVLEGPKEPQITNVGALLQGGLRVVLLGDPGGGKSTSSLKFIFDIARGSASAGGLRVGFLVVLKDYADRYANGRMSMIDYLHSLCETPYAVPAPKGAIEYLLMNGAAAVVFDGLDELLDTSLRRDVVKAVEGFTHRYPSTQVLVTSRRVGYEEAALDEDLFATASLEDFGASQVENYALKWFSLDESLPQAQRNELASSFLQDSEYVRDLRSNPLMLSLMCGLYSGERYIPRNRPDVYEKCALLLFERWDKQRGIVAPLPFDAHVMSSIRSLALWLYPQQQSRDGLPRAELVAFMTEYLNTKRFDDRDEAENAANSFIDFCRGRAWVLTDVGSERYWFTHQTFLEFFAASQLVRENTSAEALVESLWDHLLRAEWDVVCQLALQALGKSVEDGADDFLLLLVNRAQDSQGNLRRRTNLLSFAARSLAFIVPRPSVLRALVGACLQLAQEGPPNDLHERRRSGVNPALELLDGTAENRALTEKYVLEYVTNQVQSRALTEELLALVLYWSSYRRRLVVGIRKHRSTDEYGTTIKLSREVEPLLSEWAGQRSWVAMYAVEDGSLSAKDAVAIFGMSVFYETLIGDDQLDPPTAWKITRGVNRGSPRYWTNPKGKVLTTSQVRDIYDLAMSMPAPWLTAADKYMPLVSLGSLISDDLAGSATNRGLLNSAAVVMTLPILELNLRFSPRVKGNSSRSAQFLGAFRDRNQKRRGRLRDAESVMDQLSMLPDARRLILSWLANEITFVADLDDPSEQGELPGLSAE